MYCLRCGNIMQEVIPEGDTLHRHLCPSCGYIHYENPKIVVGSVCLDGEDILLCRRAIDPQKGKWTLPAGYMELGETLDAAAQREALEEACAHITIHSLLAVYSLPHINQVQVMFYAHPGDRSLIRPGIESMEVGFFRPDALPEPIAF